MKFFKTAVWFFVMLMMLGVVFATGPVLRAVVAVSGYVSEHPEVVFGVAHDCSH